MGIYICLAVTIVVLGGLILFLDDKRREQQAELNRIQSILFDKDQELKAVKREINGLAESVKVRDQQEAKLFEGVNSILNYDISTARKAAGHHGEEG